MKNIYGNDPVKESWEKVKNQSRKEKLAYFNEYYLLRCIAILIGIAAIVIVAVVIINNKRPNVIAGNIYDLDIDENSYEDLRLLLCDKLSLDSKKYKIDVANFFLENETAENRIYQNQALAVQIAAGNIDFIIGKEDFVTAFLNPEDEEDTYYLSLDAVLPEELLASLTEKGRILFVDTTYAGTRPMFIRTDNSSLAGLLNFPEDKTGYAFAIVSTAKNKEALIELAKMLAE